MRTLRFLERMDCAILSSHRTVRPHGLFGGEPGELEHKLYADVAAQVTEITTQFAAVEMRKAAQATRALWVLGNEYLQEAARWTAISAT